MATLHWLGPGYDLMTASPSMDRMFERFFGYRTVGPETGTPTYSLPVDILEAEDAYELHASVAGVPQDGVTYTANAAFGQGAQLNPGEYVFANSTAATVSITSLQPNTTYYFSVFEYDGTGTNAA